MDEFQEKRGMVKVLLDMLKKSAADEVGHGMEKPADKDMPAKGIEIEKVSVLPHEHEEGDMSPEEASMSDEAHMAEEKAETPAEEMAEHMPMEEQDEEEMPTPAFMSFMKKKGKK